MNVIFCILSDGISGNHGCSGQQIRKDPATFKEMRFKRMCDIIPYIHYLSSCTGFIGRR